MATQSAHPEIRKLQNQNVQLRRDVNHLKDHDRLTGLLNRTAFIDISERMLQELEPLQTLSAFIEISIAGIPRIAGGLGRFASDYILSAIANRINQCVGIEFIACRLDFSHFAFFIPDSDGPLEVLAAAKKLAEAISVPIDWIDRKIILETRAGVAIASESDRNGRTLLQNAGLARRQVADKQSPNYIFYKPAFANMENRNAELRVAIEESVAKDYLRLQYQPIFDIKTASLVGFEALMRMQHPKLGMISPAEFIPLAEEANLISELGRWALAKACRVAMDWPNNLIVAVNVSPNQFYNGTLLRDVHDALEAHKFPAYRLEVEITENTMLKDSELVFSQLNSLRELGCSIALDDFGTGYSSLSYLWKFRFSKLKIDRSFIQALGSSDDVKVILKSMLDLSRSLAMKVTAEGVETQAQVTLMRELGCDFVQGYLCGRPTDEKDLGTVIALAFSDQLQAQTESMLNLFVDN
jgi:EAL domain-containing protein (putative c-di-GMP-specific phosphodiesterase class I)/GGDEF domain-containing protein